MPLTPIGAHNVNDFLNEVTRCGYSRGLKPRDYKACPQGYLPHVAAFPDSLLIKDVNEQKKLLAAQQASKRSLYDIRMANYDILKSLDQDGLGLCVTEDTEVLTEHGWIAWPQYDWNRLPLVATVNPITHVMEFQRPFEKHVYPYKGEMIYSTNRRLDFGVTPDHRMYVRKWDEAKRTLSDQYTFQRAKNLGWYVGMMAAPRGFIGTEIKRIRIEGDREYDGDDFVALVALVTSDGFAGGAHGSKPGKGTRNLVSFACFREDRREVTAALASRLGFTECPSRPGVWNRWDAGALAEWFRINAYTSNELGAKNKRVPDIIKVLTCRQIRHFLDFFGDRSYGDSEAYYSTSKRLIDDLQELCLRVGKRGSICLSKERDQMMPQGKICHSSQLYTLCIASGDQLSIDHKKQLEQDHYNGTVYCAGVPNGTLVTRRNGSVLISGNCWAFSSTKAAMYARVLMGEPGLVLSAWYVAGKIKGWRDEGGWGAESSEFIASNGVPTMDRCSRYSSSAVASDAVENALLHKNITFFEGTDDPEQNWLIKVSAALRGWVWVDDYNWLSHSMCGCRIVDIDSCTADNDNSWNDIDQYGEHGLYRIQCRHAKPDNIVVLATSMPSVG